MCIFYGKLTVEEYVAIYSPHRGRVRLIAQLNHLHILELRAIDGEAYECAHLVEAVVACRAGVDVEHVECTVVLHLQWMRVRIRKK